jgi:hypothetical protein
MSVTYAFFFLEMMHTQVKCCNDLFFCGADLGADCMIVIRKNKRLNESDLYTGCIPRMRPYAHISGPFALGEQEST